MSGPVSADELGDFDDITRQFIEILENNFMNPTTASDDVGLTDSVDVRYVFDSDFATFTETASVHPANVNRIIGAGALMAATSTMTATATVIPTGQPFIEERLRNVQ